MASPTWLWGTASNSLTDNLGNVAVLLGNGDGTFQTAVPYHRGGYGASSVALADVNGDGKLDLVVANCSTSIKSCSDADGNVVVLLGNGNGTFQTATALRLGRNHSLRGGSGGCERGRQT